MRLCKNLNWFNGNKTYNKKPLAVNSGCYRVCRKEVDSDQIYCNLLLLTVTSEDVCRNKQKLKLNIFVNLQHAFSVYNVFYRSLFDGLINFKLKTLINAVL